MPAFGALAALTLLRLAVAAIAPLAPDEAYYWVWSRALAPGYPDHPPMVALWMRLGTALAGDTPLGIRLLGPLSVAVASVLLVDAAERLLPRRRAGLLAAALLNATLLLGVGAVIMTPDTPLLFFWTCCLWAAARWLRPAVAQHGEAFGSDYWWLAIGLFAGLAMTSKYTAAFLWFGIALWLLATPSAPSPAAAACTMARRGAWWCGRSASRAVERRTRLGEFRSAGRTCGEWHPASAVRFVGELIGGQIGLVTPLVFVLFTAGVVFAVRRAWRTARSRLDAAGGAYRSRRALVFIQHALGDRVQGNWPAIIYPAAAIAAAGLTEPAWRRLHAPALALGLAITLIVYLQAIVAPLRLPIRFDPITLRLSGWDAFAAGIAAVRRQQGADFVVADQYGVAAELAFDLPADIPVVGIEPRWSRFDLPRPTLTGRTGILVRSARRADDIDRERWSEIADLGTVERSREGSTIETFHLFRVTGQPGPEPAALLPRPR